MKERLTLKNALISFTPSFLGNGWETSLLPRHEKKNFNTDFRITFGWFKKVFAKMQKRRQEKEVSIWTTNAIAK